MLSRLAADTKGATAVEYSLIGALLALAAFTVATSFGGGVVEAHAAAFGVALAEPLP